MIPSRALLAACVLGALAIPTSSAATRQTQSTLIRGGQLVDGTGGAPRIADVRLSSDTIAEIGSGLAPRAGELVLDASRLTVAPGFIDPHSHADRGLDDHPDAATQIRQGITTAIVGQDGESTVPIAEFYERIEHLKPGINFATSVGHGTIRSIVLGGDFRRAATPAELEVMTAIVERAMRDGALGLSSGVEYDPGFFSTLEELVALAAVSARHGGYYSSHVRDEEKQAFAAFREAIEVGRRTQLPVLISHIKLAAKPVWGRTGEVFDILAEGHRNGVRVMADWYPYPYWQSSIYVLNPAVRDVFDRRKWEIGFAETGGPQNVLVTSYRPDSGYVGKTIADIAAIRRTDPVTATIDMIRAAGPGIGIIGTSMDEADMEKFLAHPDVLISSDGSPIGRHPRGYGAFPRVLARYVRDRKVVSLSDAIAKMTGRTAAHVGLTDRGTITPGKRADVVVFDARAIQDRGTPQSPSLEPVGVRHVIVNGEVVLHDGQLTGARPGRGVRRLVLSPSGSARARAIGWTSP